MRNIRYAGRLENRLSSSPWRHLPGYEHSYSGYQFSTGSLLSLRLFLPRDQAKKSEIYRDKETYTVAKYSVENEDCCTLSHSGRSGKMSRTIPGSLSMEHDRRDVAIGRE